MGTLGGLSDYFHVFSIHLSLNMMTAVTEYVILILDFKKLMIYISWLQLLVDD